MLFDTVSDLHIDTYRRKRYRGVDSVDFATLKNPGSEVLVVAGDTGNHQKRMLKLVKKAARFYPYVVFVDGNHEHYDTRRPIPHAEKYLRDFTKRHPNCVYLDARNHLRVGATVFVGCNGWYDWQIMCPEISTQKQFEAWGKHNGGSNDAVYIRTGGMSMADRAKMQAFLLREQVKQFDADPDITEIVVVSHTVPARFLVMDKPYDPEWQYLSGSYANSQFMCVLDASTKIKLWVYGHTHERLMRRRNGVTFINNSRGYFSEQYEKSEWFIVQADSSGD